MVAVRRFLSAGRGAYERVALQPIRGVAMRPLCPPRRSSSENVGRSGHRTGAAARRSPRGPATLRTLVAVTAALLLAPASASAAFPVGHTVKRIIVPGTLANEVRAVDVQLWYPADAASFAGA